MSHIFFGQIKHPLWQVFATHPPLDTRIRQLDPLWDGRYIARKITQYQEQPSRPGAAEVGVGRAALVAAVLATRHTTTALTLDFDDQSESFPSEKQLAQTSAAHFGLPAAVAGHCHDPVGAQGLSLALFLSKEPDVRQQQLEEIDRLTVPGLVVLANALAPEVAALGPGQRLPLLELSLPALKSISLPQYRRFKNALLYCIQADRRTQLYEWCLFQLLRHYLDPEFLNVTASRPRYRKLSQVRDSLQILLSVLAYESGTSAAIAFMQGQGELGLNNLQLLPREQCSVSAFSKAVQNLADCYPLLKPRVIKAMTQVAGGDGKVTPAEREIIYSVAAVMDCPLAPEGNWPLREGPAKLL